MDIKKYGFTPAMLPGNADGVPARVTAVHRERYELVCEYGKVFGRLKIGVYFGEGTEDFPTAGDFVLLSHNPDGDSQILRTLPRSSFFSRRDPTHTTTHRQLIMLKSGVMVIDTPGMWDVSMGLGEAFADVERYLGRCRFFDCKHQTEPGCAVRAAIESGELPAERWESYNRLKREARYADDRGAYLREKQRWHKEIAKQNKQKEKAGKKHDG